MKIKKKRKKNSVLSLTISMIMPRELKGQIMLAQGGEQLLAESITVSNFKNTVSKLVKRYVAEFIDSFNQYIKLIYIFYLKRILIARNV